MLATSSSGFKKIKIGVASPERIRFWSYGEVEKPETINYRTFRPERKGLFCEKIFGPVKDWECACGKYRRVRYRGIICERCGVEVTHSKVRRERMGHIELATPVSHIWYLKGIPSYMGVLLNMTVRTLEDVIYYDSYIVTDVDDAIADQLQEKQLLSESEYLELKEKFGNKFKADIGAKAIRDLLAKIEINKLIEELREEIKSSKGQKKIKVTKRLRIAESFGKAGNKPDWMVMDVIPVMPPDLRPMVQLEGGRFATSDLNDLYRRVVNRNNRLKRLLDLGAPGMIIRNEKRMLQESVDVLINNGSRGRSVTGSNGRPLKSLSEIIQGKQGRFRQNLLGKRVDYSGRSVIVVGPHLKLHQCGLPKTMALELFKPFVIRRLVEKDIVQNVKSAKRKIERKDIVVWDALEEVIEGHPVLLNRAPTLHRLGIQAFEPVLVEGKAIQIPPLVCSAFNADFDGDQMAIHIPLSIEAQAEARLLMLASNNILSPANGRSIVTPTQDMVLGLYYLTTANKHSKKGEGMVFMSDEEAIKAYELRAADLQTKITVRRHGKRIESTIGRIIFNDSINVIIHEKNGLQEHDFINEVVGKKQIANLLLKWFKTYGTKVAAELADQMKDLGFKFSTTAGFSISIDDLVVPESKKEIIARSEDESAQVEKLYQQGILSSREKKQKIIEIWRGTSERVTEAMLEGFDELNNIFVMANSGARGSVDQVKQLAGMRGLMADSQGNTVDIPIKSNFREGLTLTEYFISSYGARKGLVDTALRTADSGYLTRRLVDVAQDVIINEEDCQTKKGIILTEITGIIPLAERLEGRTTLDDVISRKTGQVILKADEEIDYDKAKEIVAAGIEDVRVRSVLTCRAKVGICQKCYGRDLSSHQLISLGEAVGIIAAQSIGEPGTQLTMRTFHTGGVDLSKASKIELKSTKTGTVRLSSDMQLKKLKDEFGRDIVLVVREGKLQVKGKEPNNEESIAVPRGALLLITNNQKVDPDTVLAVHDQTFEYIISGHRGQVYLLNLDIIEKKDSAGAFVGWISKSDGEVLLIDVNKKLDVDIVEGTKIKVKVGQLLKKGEILAGEVKSPIAGVIFDINANKVIINPGESYPISAGSDIMVKNGQVVEVNDILARESAGSMLMQRARDIVSGLPRVEELFEARKPKLQSILSEIDGTVETSEKGGLRLIIVHDPVTSESKEYKVPLGTKLKVYTGKEVKKGDLLTDGVINPHDLIIILGVQQAQEYLLEEIQKVYRSQGVTINDKHIEVIMRQMTKRIQIVEMGDSDLLPDEKIDIIEFEEINKRLRGEGKQPARGTRVLLGITKASLNTDSFISAASFQETARVLTMAAVRGQIDDMVALKENVIIGKLIPAGTGFPKFRNIEISMKDIVGEDNVVEEPVQDVIEEMVE
ncbi:MAG: DNA-directed RNA polymerase subunit beta' [Candidatus Margulisiibacteriota bacterium]|nr:MAG: hypothetical protein A2X43_00620 [Candidatus Margulisbacteria bacterium GWD2_39_127]OGI04647.1 MAG: hypothetical protein A2X42_08075 [Candidatus Margulisbacteria bacterium GWF2_38_17]OGI11821.1 MAG: hypothetical protein A2X41_11195 [Candidatus Margulisbacteria bacterium GWE2_39_32]PZM79807.1 MAG: DNA-directed RNA polymerase subunit beta' [Candidatus Margulisiibacteriota bacterium]HAR62714.1 DNA-directed RNA polymerase subunit beta' [Candidatus Margulisiibacteriota bacterium]